MAGKLTDAAPDTTTVAILRVDKPLLSKLKRIQEGGRHETDYEILHRIIAWQFKTRQQKLKDLLPGGYDEQFIRDATRG